MSTQRSTGANTIGGEDKENSKRLQNMQILPPSIGAERRSVSATSSIGAAGRQHKLKQRFTVIRKLGKGTYGKVQLAINKETGQEVAIKTIKKTKIENEQDLERVRREIQIMSSIEHPHIIHIYEVFENKDKIVLIMQYAPGGELYGYVSQLKVLDESEARRLFRQIATAIYYCHKNKICHRDLKLENILLDEKNNAKLADFGLSNVFDKNRQLKTFCGSPLYASPEIVQGSPYEGPEVDCWSLGVLLYTLVYGSMPFDGSNFKRLVKQISEASYYEPKQKSRASTLIRRLLCADPQKRATIFDICQDAWVNGMHSVLTPNSSSPQRPVSPVNRSSQQTHTSLLQVAQDMANLTPVRLDILLALNPTTVHESTTSGPQQSSVIPRQSEQEMQSERYDTMIEDQQRIATGTTNGWRQQRENQSPILLDVDKGRANSPVASYVVRDLVNSGAAEESQTLIDPERMVDQIDSKYKFAANPVHNQDGEQMEVDNELVRRQEAKENNETQPQINITESVDLEVIQMNSSPTHQVSINCNKISDTLGVGEDRSPLVLEEGKERLNEMSSDSPPVNVSILNDLIEEADKDCEIKEPDVLPTTHTADDFAIEKANIIVREVGKQSQDEMRTEPITISEEATKIDPVEDQAAPEPKPKKTKKKIIVVKKKRKVSKKDATGAETESNELRADAKLDSNETQSDGKDACGSGAPQSDTAGSTLTRASRRQSALIADVSQKLLQHQHQTQNPAPHSAAIEMDQTQLASVRVSDKKDEFERRASLAGGKDQGQRGQQQQQQHSDKGSQERIGLEVESNDQKESTEGVVVEPATSRRETVKFTNLTDMPILQDVDKQKPISIVVLDAPVQASINPSRQEETSMTGQETGLNGSNLGVSASEDRSDSVETIKPESEIKLSERPRIRSSLQIDLCGLEPVPQVIDSSENKNKTLDGPVPITRSYKKVTFTRDGSCVTETGRIYSTRNQDGTLRRVERKSKVTHFAGESNNKRASADTSKAFEESHKEVVYDQTESTLWPDSQNQRAAGSSRVGRPFERLIMPSTSHLRSAVLTDDDNQRFPNDSQSKFRPDIDSPAECYDSLSSCSSGSTDVFDDIFDTWTGAISMFNRRLSDVHGSLINRAFASGTGPSVRLRSSGGGRLFNRQEAASPRVSQTPQPNSSQYQRCGSVEPSTGSPFSAFDGFPQTRKHRHHRHRANRHQHTADLGGRASADATGYESDVPYERPASAAACRTLGSARGVFGSSHLSRPHNHEASGRTESLFDQPLDAGTLFESLNQQLGFDPFGGSLIMQEIQMEHEKMRRKMNLQCKQLWQGSTPALHEVADDEPLFGSQPFRQTVRTRADSTSDSARGRPMNQPSNNHIHESLFKESASRTQSRSSGGQQEQQHLVRQSFALDSAPLRWNSASSGDCLPPKQPASSRHSSSKTSLLSSRLANLHLSGLTQVQQQGHKSANFIELKRNSSSALSSPSSFMERRIPIAAEQQVDAISSQVADTKSDKFRNELQAHRQEANSQKNTDANCRIQSWLQQSAGNLSYSSGSKSSASDTLPSSSNPSDVASQVLRRDESTCTNLTSSSFFNQQQQQQQNSQHPHQLPPICGKPRSLVGSRQAFLVGAPLASSQVSSMIVRSSSKQSMSSSSHTRTGNDIDRAEIMEQRHSRVQETIGPNGKAEISESEEMFTHQSTTTASSNTAQVSSHSTLRFSFPDEIDEQLAEECQNQVTVSHQQQQQVVSRRLVSPSSIAMSRPVESANSWHQHEPATSLAYQQQQSASLSGRQMGADFDALNDLDSLVGSGAELESISSSSLLEQLRARGYRSMINQRLVDANRQHSQQQQQTSQAADSNVITTSSTSMTMSSSGFGGGGGGQVEEERIIRTTMSTSSKVQQQQQDVSTEAVETAQNEVHQNIDEVAEATQAPTSDSKQSHSIDLLQGQRPATNMSTAPSKDHEENNEEEDDDDDVRQAKANIRIHLDRMRETENFLKSMQEEEEKYLKQRRDLFLFNNLLIGTKLNGVGTPHGHETAHNGTINFAEPQILGSTTTLNRDLGMPINRFTSLEHINGLEHSSYSPRLQNSFANQSDYGTPSSSCFNSDLFRPTYMSSNNYNAGSGYKSPRDSGESFYTTPTASARVWRRSKSQLGDQFTGRSALRLNLDVSTEHQANPLVGSNFAMSNHRRPLSANIDSMSHLKLQRGSMSPYLGANRRRSASQVRAPTSVASALNCGTQTMLSEYRSSFGPNLDRSSIRSSRSPVRVVTNNTTPIDDIMQEQNGHTELDEMHHYRVSNYKPKVSYESNQSSFGAKKQGRRLSRRSSTLNLLTQHNDESTAQAESLFSERRRSCQSTANLISSSDIKEKPTSVDRRSSLLCEYSRYQDDDNSRLSELEQRIQANKKRREELLTGIKSSNFPEQIDPKLSDEIDSIEQNKNDHSNSDEFERPICTIAKGQIDDNCLRSINRTRPSRLESMEARIKRRSYCVRINSPERARPRASSKGLR